VYLLNQLKMSKRKPVRYLAVPIVLVVLLVAATTMGIVWHHHASSSEANCPICHVNHQPVGQPLESNQAPVLAPLCAQDEPQEPGFAPSPVLVRVPARAPPAV
jgi:flagellar basal body-associated protein FliL